MDTVMLDPVATLDRDLRTASKTLSDEEARYLVDYYYRSQEDRIRCAHQTRTAEKAGEPHQVIAFFQSQSEAIEKSLKTALDVYSYNDPLGFWMRSIDGIGPVIAAGFLAHLDTRNPPTTVGKWWSFAGYNPQMEWEKGQKRPFNQGLKTLCWKLGDCFVKLGDGHQRSFYAPLYRGRKAWYVAKNERGGFAERASETLAERNIKDRDTRAVYESGRLPDGRIDLMARRWTVKIFLSHLHEMAWRLAHPGTPIPKPWVIEHGGHTDYLPPPNQDLLDPSKLSDRPEGPAPKKLGVPIPSEKKGRGPNTKVFTYSVAARRRGEKEPSIVEKIEATTKKNAIEQMEPLLVMKFGSYRKTEWNITAKKIQP